MLRLQLAAAAFQKMYTCKHNNMTLKLNIGTFLYVSMQLILYTVTIQCTLFYAAIQYRAHSELQLSGLLTAPQAPSHQLKVFPT